MADTYISFKYPSFQFIVFQRENNPFLFHFWSANLDKIHFFKQIKYKYIKLTNILDREIFIYIAFRYILFNTYYNYILYTFLKLLFLISIFENN